MTEKRIHTRFGPLVIKASLTLGADRRDGYLTNVSEGGAFLALNEPPSLGTRGEIRAMLPWHLGELRASARVAGAPLPVPREVRRARRAHRRDAGGMKAQPRGFFPRAGGDDRSLVHFWHIPKIWWRWDSMVNP